MHLPPHDAVRSWLHDTYGFVAAVQFEMRTAITQEGMTVKEVASRLDMRESKVWQILIDHDADYGLRAVADIAWATGRYPRLSVGPIAA